MIGELNKRATLQKPIITHTTSGGSKATYSDFMTVWCGLTPVGEYGNREGGQDNQIARFKCLIRYSQALKALLTKDTRVIINNVTYRIEGMETDKKYITLKLAGTKNTL